MKRLSTSLLVIFLAFLLNGCGEWDNLVDSISGSDDDDAVPTAQTEALPRKDISTNTKTDTKTDTQTETKTDTKTEKTPVTKPTTVTSSYPGVAGNGILWKPVSESSGKLVVLLAPSYGEPQVRVLDTNKKVLDTGKFVGRTNPNRATYRFSKAGRGFPKPCLLQVGSKIFKVADGSKRYE